jgi:hypothetical protein
VDRHSQSRGAGWDGWWTKRTNVEPFALKFFCRMAGSIVFDKHHGDDLRIRRLDIQSGFGEQPAEQCAVLKEKLPSSGIIVNHGQAGIQGRGNRGRRSC